MEGGDRQEKLMFIPMDVMLEADALRRDMVLTDLILKRDEAEADGDDERARELQHRINEMEGR